MQTVKTLGLLTIVSAISCIPIEDGKETGEDSGTPVVADPLSTSVSWGDSSVSLSLENAETGASYYWGIAENAGSCLTSEYGCWTGEDCFMGFDLTDGGNYLYCHEVGATGGSLSYGAAPDSVVEGGTTVFSSANFSTVVTYLLDNAASTEAESCWVWGADTTYYNGYGKTCVEM